MEILVAWLIYMVGSLVISLGAEKIRAEQRQKTEEK